MTNWEQKRNDMRRKITRDTRIFFGVLIATAVASVFTTMYFYQCTQEKELEKDYLLLQEMRKQSQKKYR